VRRSERLAISEIARVLGISRNTVKAALASDGPPKYQRAAAGSVADEAEPRIRELLAAYPGMPATVIAERIGWSYSIRTLSERVRELRPVYLPPDSASRTTYVAGEIAQCDFWFPDVAVPVGFGQVRTATALPVLTMVCGYSRWASAVLIPTRTAEDLYAGWWQHLSTLDTPGLATINSTSSAATQRALVDTPSSQGLERPDGTLFLTDGAPRADEVAVLNQMGATRVDTLALISHADSFGEGAFSSVDPLEMAAKHAERLKGQLGRLAGSVLPVSGLLAETALTGHLTEDDARALRQLGTLEDFELAGILAGQDDASDTDRQVDRLLEHVGEYGIVYGRKLAEPGAAALAQWMADKSGITAVREQITRRFVYRSDVLKARQILPKLQDWAPLRPTGPTSTRSWRTRVCSRACIRCMRCPH
jgi:hypothetical protein